MTSSTVADDDELEAGVIHYLPTEKNLHYRFTSSKSIIYINYYLYFIIFYTTNFFSFIPISTTILFFYFNFGFTYNLINTKYAHNV
jgi:hypothetical protein